MIVFPHRYSVISFRKFVAEACQKYSHQELAKESGVARSTIYRILDGTIADIKLSKAHQIAMGIKNLEKKKKSS